MIEAAYMAKGNMSPTNGWAAQSEVGTCRAKIHDAGKACFVQGGTSSLKRCQTLRGYGSRSGSLHGLRHKCVPYGRDTPN